MEQFKPRQISQYSKVWYLVFTESETKLPLYQRMAIGKNKAFGHVLLITPVTNTHCQIIDPKPSHIELQLRELDKSFSGMILGLAEKWPVIEYVSKPESIRHISNMVPSCVSVAKSFLGLSAPVVTPYGLYKWMLRNGGERI